MKTFNELKKNLKKDYKPFTKIDLAILGDSATQLLNVSIKGCSYEYKINLNIYEADYNQIEYEILNYNSNLYKVQPKYILIYFSSKKLIDKFYSIPLNEREIFANSYTENVIELIQVAQSKLNESIILLCNFQEIDDSIFGHQANKISKSFLYQCRKINFLLSEYTLEKNNVLIVDLAGLQNKYGIERCFNSNIYITTEMVLSTDILPNVAEIILNIINVRLGVLHKCVILDLDNTLWGGVIGDDGYENIEIGTLGIGKVFTEFQKWLKELKHRGIILAVCSKNNESVAKEAFLKNKEMVLKLEDISVFMANWDNKADNIKTIQSILNIGFSSMIFIDDNPVERQIVKENIPEITVPNLPEDPACYLEYLYGLNLFENTGITSEDSNRTNLYQIENQRLYLKKSFVDEKEFLKSLEMLSLVEGFNKNNLSRVAQLSQRSNQFNLRTMRYDESDIINYESSNQYENFTFTLNDKFGENGLICVVVLKQTKEATMFIENWFMSCRVLKRGMENFVLNIIVNKMKLKGVKQIEGEYIPSTKNQIVVNHYYDLGFTETNGKWVLDINSYLERETYINFK
jgi:FkbH-like protein